LSRHRLHVDELGPLRGCREENGEMQLDLAARLVGSLQSDGPPSQIPVLQLATPCSLGIVNHVGLEQSSSRDTQSLKFQRSADRVSVCKEETYAYWTAQREQSRGSDRAGRY
jgi:hypothetical protein